MKTRKKEKGQKGKRKKKKEKRRRGSGRDQRERETYFGQDLMPNSESWDSDGFFWTIILKLDEESEVDSAAMKGINQQGFARGVQGKGTIIYCQLYHLC